MVGTFIRVFIDDGYGFIRGNDSRSYFVHVSDLREGEQWDFAAPNRTVEFEPAPSDKGNKLKATDVKFLNS